MKILFSFRFELRFEFGSCSNEVQSVVKLQVIYLCFHVVESIQLVNFVRIVFISSSYQHQSTSTSSRFIYFQVDFSITHQLVPFELPLVLISSIWWRRKMCTPNKLKISQKSLQISIFTDFLPSKLYLLWLKNTFHFWSADEFPHELMKHMNKHMQKGGTNLLPTKSMRPTWIQVSSTEEYTKSMVCFE